jgi:hypothetical protein
MLAFISIGDKETPTSQHPSAPGAEENFRAGFPPMSRSMPSDDTAESARPISGVLSAAADLCDADS